MARKMVLSLALVAGLVLPGTAAARVYEKTFRLGPVALGPYQSKIRYTHIPAPAVDGYVTHMHARVVDADGHPIPQYRIMLHHVVFKNLSRLTPYCGGETSEPFYGTGEENESMVLPDGYGYRVRKHDKWAAGYMLMNHRWYSRKVFLEWTVTLDTTHELEPVDPYWINVSCGRDPIFNVPGGQAPGTTYRRSTTWTAPDDGRIVAVGAHFHGGGEQLRLTEPACRDRTIGASVPRYGLASDPLYHVVPQVHEPGPVFTTWTTTPTGIPIAKGQKIRLDGLYDGAHIHARVMAIMHVYVAKGPPPSSACPPLPGDERTIDYHGPYRTAPPSTFIALAKFGAVKAIVEQSLPGPVDRLKGGARVTLRGFAFSKRKLSIPLGSRVSWRFADRATHDVTVANGPRAFASQPHAGSGRFSWRFTVPGTYQLHCSLHPVGMNEQIVVRR